MVYFYTVFRDSIYADSIVKYLCLFYCKIYTYYHGVQCRMVLVVNLKLFCLVVAIFDLVHGVESIFHLT